jgi:hypothetical protein
MSLFGDNEYQWRETYFVLFRTSERPSAADVSDALKSDDRFEITNMVHDDAGNFESLSLKAPDDFSGMDVSFVSGEEVRETVEELLRELAKTTLNEDERNMLDQLGDCDARLDIYHFEQMQLDDQDEFLDPGGLLIVLEHLTKLCHGVGIDPQSGSLMP